MPFNTFEEIVDGDLIKLFVIKHRFCDEHELYEDWCVFMFTPLEFDSFNKKRSPPPSLKSFNLHELQQRLFIVLEQSTCFGNCQYLKLLCTDGKIWFLLQDDANIIKL